MARRRKIGDEKERDGGAAAPPVGARLFPRHCERSEAIHLSEQEVTMDCFAALAMTVNMTSHSRGALRPRFAINFPPSLSEGAGKTGCLLHPRSRVRFAQTKMHTSIQGSGSIPAFPAQWLYGLLRALPGERLSCLRRPREAFASLGLNASTAAPEPHDFAVRFRARTSIAPFASIASHRTFVTIASRPSIG